MTGTITLTAAMRSNLASLQSTADLMGSTQLKLSTGLKINSALDNPSSFFAAQGLQNSAGDLSALLDGMAQNVQAIKTATEGITSLKSMLSQAKAIAQTAQSQPGSGGAITGTASLTPALMAAASAGMAGTLGIQIGTGAVQNLVVAANDTITTTLNAINALTNVKAELVANPAVSGNFFLKISSTNGEAVTLTNVASTPATGYGLSLVASGTPADISAQKTQYTNLLTQMDKLIADTSYRGKNLINGVGADVTTQFNATNTNKLTTASVSLSTSTLALVTGANFSLTNLTNGTIIAQIDAAVTTLQNTASNFGNDLSMIQTRSDFTNNMINTFKDGANQLTVANKNEEGANMLALQTAQQLGIQALSLASQANQSVLRLFG